MTSLRCSVYSALYKDQLCWVSVWTFPYVRRWAACCVMSRTATLTSSGTSCATSYFSTTLSLPMSTWSEISLPTSGIVQFFLFPRAFNRLFFAACLCCGSVIRCFLTPGSGMEKIQIWDPGSGINIPDHISESVISIIWVKILKFFVGDPGSVVPFDPGSGIRDGKIRIRDPEYQIPDPQHCCLLCFVDVLFLTCRVGRNTHTY